MAGLNNRNFLNLWQIVYGATCPNATETHWRAGDVVWHKDRHTFTGSGYAFSVDVHRLRRSAGDGASWVLMVVVEHWWDDQREVLRSITWARALQGSARTIGAWFRDQEKARSGRAH